MSDGPAYAKGFADQEREVSIDDLPVEGEIPQWLTGDLIRNGPAKWRIGSRRLNHWFDGLAMLHRFTIHQGKVSYANKFLRNNDYAAAEDGELKYSQFATDPCRSLFKRMTANFSPTFSQNANVNIGKVADDFVAMTELPIQVRFDKDTLASIGIVDYQDALEGFVTTAHPHFDSTTKETLNYLIKFGPKSTYNVFALPAGSTTRRLIAKVPVAKPSYMHSFAVTENYVVLMEFPFSVTPLVLLTSGKPFIDNYRWRPQDGTHFTIVHKRTGATKRVHTDDAWFSFHHVNAFEDDSGIHVDVDVYPDAQIVSDLFLNSLVGPSDSSSGYQPPSLPASSVRRFTIRLDDTTSRLDDTTSSGSASVTSRELVSAPVELPRINYARNNAKDYRYVYGISFDTADGDGFLDRIVKADVTSGQTQYWLAPHTFPGEPVFVPRPESKAEDDGVLLSVVLDGEKGSSFLLVLDAQDLSELARVNVDLAIPFGFHGQFVGK